ncbi:MAG: alkaline phosphatase D family protein, partial [Steroidobacteraceae bacterium]
APTPAQRDGGMPPLDYEVGYEVATDEQFRRIAVRGKALASAQYAHSVHAEVHGLGADRDYWYRFTAGDARSAVARTRTMPAAGARVASLRLAVASCQHYEHGHFAAFRHIADDAPDCIVHVGDYIYEGAPTADRVRRHSGALCRTLADYRQRYAQYKLDPALQAAHAIAPWLLMWDDHEVANDYSGTDSGRAEDPASFLRRRAAAYQAYFEHQPLPPAAAPRAGGMTLYSSRRIGTLATIHLLDQRQYRSPQACPLPGRSGGNRLGDECVDRLDPKRTMLGAAQEQWLAQGLKSRSRWTLLAQGTVFSHVDEEAGPTSSYWSDGWTGYPAARQRVLDSLRQARSENPVILSGDLHAFVVGNVNAVPERLDTPLVATEFVGTSVSSDSRPQESLDAWREGNANVLLVDGRKRGYLAVKITDQRMQVDLVAVDNVNEPGSGRHSLSSYVVEAGNAGALPA